MFKCSVQEGWQNRNRLALGICFVQPRRAHQILFDVFSEVQPLEQCVDPKPLGAGLQRSPRIASLLYPLRQFQHHPRLR